MLTLELLEGEQVADLELQAFTMDERRHIAYLITEAWMTMIFRHGFFHADPHPANILLISGEQIGLVDFGLAGKLSDDDMSKLTALFIDAAEENVDALARRLGDLGVRYDRSREQELTGELRELYYKYYGARLSEIDPLQVIREGFALIYSQNLRLPTRFVLLDKAIATVGSVGVELYPDFNVFEVAKPYARDLMLHRYTPRRMMSRARKEARALVGIVRETPYQVHDILESLRDGQIEVGFVHKGLDEFMHKLDVAFNRLVIALVVAGGLIGSSLIGIFADRRAARTRPARDLVDRLRALDRSRRLAADRRDQVRASLTPNSSSSNTGHSSFVTRRSTRSPAARTISRSSIRVRRPSGVASVQKRCRVKKGDSVSCQRQVSSKSASSCGSRSKR